MVFVTVILITSEWQRIAAAALALWPTVEIDHEISRNEVCRRLALCGVQQLLGASLRNANGPSRKLSGHLQPPADGMLPQLPVAS